MNLRNPGARPPTSNFALPLRPYFLRLAAARFRLGLEHAIWIFTRPVLFIAGFYVLAWTGLFGRFFTYVNVAALAIFAALFVQSLGRAYQPWRPAQQTVRRYVIARRDYERVRGVRYKLPDVLDDQPNVSLDAFDQPQLAFARVMLAVDNALPVFALPLTLVILFVACAWLGLFPALFPWAHIALLILFTCLFFDGLAYALRRWQPLPESQARRLVERASGLRHRPLDVLDDRPARLTGTPVGEEQMALWQAHSFRAKAQTRYLDWPRWPQGLAAKDPYALRYALLILLAVAGLAGWGAWGGRLLVAINPAIGHHYLAPPTLDAWITPPAYTNLPPIMVATPAGGLHADDVIAVPEGSVFSAHLAERTGDVPVLTVNGRHQDFAAPEAQDFSVIAPLVSGDALVIKRGWRTIGSWHIKLIQDVPPQIAFDDTPSGSARQSLRLSYAAHDDYAVASVALRVTPRQSMAGETVTAFDIPLATPNARDVKRVAFVDLTAHPLAGAPVQLQLIARDDKGQLATSQPVDFTLPERAFLNPYAHALAEERKKLMHKPLDDILRNEAANLMAGIAHQPATYHNDPVVAMALRTGAVRLVLEPTPATVSEVADILWQAATRIEDGATGEAEQNLRSAQKDLADALDRNAPQAEVQQAIDRLHQALAQYLAQLSTRLAATPDPADDLAKLGALAGQKTNLLTPADLDRMLDNMRDLTATGARDAARAELGRLQQIMENLRSAPPQLTDDQRAGLEKLKALRQLTQDQQQLLDRTFKDPAPVPAAKQPAITPGLAADQQALAARLHTLMTGVAGDPGKALGTGETAMQGAGGALRQGDKNAALPLQNKALQALKQAQDALGQQLQQSMMMLPRGGQAAGSHGDPFGRDEGGRDQDLGATTSVPDHVEAGRVRAILDELQRRAGDSDRSKPERDYIDRLLQNF